ncbi:MAG TPA: saccharopine dehydrogenase NADP-binding domain-containing protein, partial [Anaerolineales bacterium]|nr:saccharopine dehydrogenase NADP-binding domain-containing protein [Anaerolineales bacterium]
QTYLYFMKTFLIYGSYGYTGQLIVDLAVKDGLHPILAGRDEKKLRVQAKKFNLEYRAFSLDETSKLDSSLKEVEAVLHCAGPFVHTFRQMAEACLRNKKHYVDISGELAGFEALAEMDDQAKRAGIMLLPGGGFDVVPSDCLAAHVKQRLPSATHFRLFLKGVGAGASRGTAKSSIENMHRQGRIRRDGKVVQVPPAWRVLKQDFGGGPVNVVSVGWGDVSTAYYSTGIPNIETYFAFPRVMIDFLYGLRVLGPLFYHRVAKTFLKALVDTVLPPGPSEEKRKKRFAIMIGEVIDARGNRAVSKLIIPEGYTCTALTTVEIMKRILNGDYKVGFQTPSLVYGSDFILQFAGVKREDL